MISYFEQNMIFLSAKFERNTISKEHSFMFKYFKTKQQRAFLKYYYSMKDWRKFTIHTGIMATFAFVYKLSAKFDHYMNLYETAKKNMDFDTISLLNKRRIRLPKRLS